MLTDFQFADLGTRRDRASGAYFATSQLLVVTRPHLPAEAAAKAELLVQELRADYHRLCAELTAAVAERRAAAQQQVVADREAFEAAYAAQQQTTRHLQAA